MNKCNLCLLLIIGILCGAIPTLENNNAIQYLTNNLENITMVKEYDAADQSITLDTTKNGIRNIWFDGTYYFIADVNGTTGYIYRYNSSWASKTEVWSGTIASSNISLIVAIPSILYVNSVYHVAFVAHWGSGISEGGKLTHIYSSTAGGGSGTWTAEDLLGSTPFKTQFSSVQLIAIGTDLYYYIFLDAGMGLTYATIVNIDASSISTATETGKFTGGYSDGTYIWYLQYLSGIYKIFKWDPVNEHVEDSSPTLSNGTDISFDYSQFWINGSNKLIAWKDTLWYYTNSVWKVASAIASTYPAPHWYLDSGVLKIKYFTFGTNWLEIEGDLIINNVYSTTHNLYAAWDSYLLDRDNKLWKIGLADSTRFIEFIPYDIVEGAQTATFKAISAIAENEFIALYNDSSVLLIKGEAKNVTGTDIRSGLIKTLAENDLRKFISYTSAGAETAAVAIANILTAEADHITAGTLTSSVATNTWALDGELQVVITKIAHNDGLIWNLTPAYALDLNAGNVDSTKSFKSSDSQYGSNFKPTVNTQLMGTVIGIGDGTIKTTVVKDLSNGTQVYYIPGITQAQMDTTIAEIADNENQIQNQYDIENVFGLLPLQAGQLLTYENTDESVTSALHHIAEFRYNAIDNYILKLVLHDVLLFKKVDLTPQHVYVATNTMVNDLQGQIDTITGVSGLISDTAYSGSWDTVTGIGASKNAIYDQMETRALKATTLTGAGAIAIDTDQAAHDLSANRTISLENDAGNNITAIETAAVTDSATKIPNSAIVYDIKTTADAAMPKAGGIFVGGVTQTTGQAITDNSMVTVDGSAADNQLAEFTANGVVGRTIGIADTNIVRVDGSPSDNQLAEFTANGIVGRTIGIADTNIVRIDGADIADNEYARFTANGLESKSRSEVITDLADGYIIKGSDNATNNWKSVYCIDTGTSGTPTNISINNWSDPPVAYEVVASATGTYKSIAKTHLYPIHFTYGTIQHIIYKSTTSLIASCWYQFKDTTSSLYNLLNIRRSDGSSQFFKKQNDDIKLNNGKIVYTFVADEWVHLCIRIVENNTEFFVNGHLVTTRSSTNTVYGEIYYLTVTNNACDIYLDALYEGNSIDEAMASLYNGNTTFSTKDQAYCALPLKLNQNPITNVTTYESVVATGTAPLVVASTTKVSNLNADQIDGCDVETAAITNDATKLPTSALAYAVKVTADAALPKSAGSSHPITGDLYFNNNLSLYGRNYENTAWLECLKLDGSNKLQFGADVVSSYFAKPVQFHDYLVLDNQLYQANNYAHQWRNAANNAWLECLKLDTSDILQIGSGAIAVESVTTQPKTDNTYYLGKNDDDSPKAWKGIILKDQAGTGKYYRLEVYNNALRIVDLTD